MWSQVIDTPLGLQARTVYDSDPARHYHNWGHILRLYWHAEHTFALPYDADLDLAILAHDVIYDAAPDKEQRSIDWLTEHAKGDVQIANAHIAKTIEHRPSDDNRMVLLDLADLMDAKVSMENFDKIKRESIALYGIDEAMFRQANGVVMTALAQRIKTDLPNCGAAEDLQYFEKILTGIVSVTPR